VKNFAPLLLLFALTLFAADFWQNKPFTEWSDKDVQKMLNASPWAKRTAVETGPPRIVDPSGGGGRGRGNAGALGDGGNGSEVPDTAPPSIPVVIRWQTALPMKQALARIRFGAEAGTSDEARKFIERQDSNYVIGLSGLPPGIAAGDVKEKTTLAVKGKSPLQPMEVQFAPRERFTDVFMTFPRTAPFTLDDKEVEFSSKIGPLSIRYKFRLKDMVFNGKLEL
jgi:hypothetical protein